MRWKSCQRRHNDDDDHIKAHRRRHNDDDHIRTCQRRHDPAKGRQDLRHSSQQLASCRSWKVAFQRYAIDSVRWQYVIDIVIIDYFWKPTWGWHRRWGLQGSSGGSAVPRRTCNISWHKKFIFFKYIYHLHFVLTSIAAWWYFLWTLSPVHPIRQSQQQLQFQHFGSTHLCHLYLSCTCQH